MDWTKEMVSLEEIYRPIQSSLAEVEERIFELLSTPNHLSQEGIRYFFSRHGKLLRPALCLLGARFSENEEGVEKILPVAASCEILHAATLIHDDIIDAAYMRRNQPTLNAKWGSKVSVLIGDYLFARAIETISRAQNQRVASLFLDTAIQLCDGEMLEIKEQNNFNIRESLYFEIIEKKTASLLAACIESGAILADRPVEEIAALKQYGLYFGIAFQLVDDCLDFDGEEQELGKVLGSDCNSGVLTLPLIRLISLISEEKKSEVFKMFKSAPSREKFEYLSQLVSEYETISYALEKAQEFLDKARLELSIFRPSPARQSLEQLLDFVISRRK